MPPTPTASGECYVNKDVWLQFNNSYTTIYGSHSVGGSCVITLHYIDNSGHEIGVQGDVLSLPNVESRSANITVPSNTAFVQVNERGSGIGSNATQVWFS